MNGARTTFMRRGYLLTALAAAVLLAASPGIASAQSIGFVGTSGTVAETASLESGAFEAPHTITIRASGIPQARRMATLDAVTLTVGGIADGATVRYAVINPATGAVRAAGIETATGVAVGSALPTITVAASDFSTSGNEMVLRVVQGDDGSRDDNWLSERITFTLGAGAGLPISPNIYTLTVNDTDVAPVANFNVPSFTLTEGSERTVGLRVVTGRRGARVPPAATADAAPANARMVTVSVSNSDMVSIGTVAADTADTQTAVMGCPDRPSDNRGTAVYLQLVEASWGTETGYEEAFGRTGRLQTALMLDDLAGGSTADITATACGDTTGFTNPQITLTILPNDIVEPPTRPAIGSVTIGSPLTITIDSDEMVPTLSFSPTDVTIDEGDSVSTRLIADGMHASEVGMVKLMVEGDAMVDLYHEDTMLEEMDGYVMVDLGSANSARLTAMSMSDPDLMDGDMAYKAWKLMEGSSDAMIGDDYWFRVDVRGSTAVPALPLVGQLLLALFLMAGGSRLYRRHRG